MAKRKISAAEAARKKLLEAQWQKSLSTQSSLEAMAQGGLLPPAELVVWRAPAPGERYPQPYEGEIVVFEDYFLRGVGIPVHNFLRDLCIFWAISICNLPPNSILTIALFVAYCECYLGRAPHFNLFRHLYVLKKKGEGSEGSQVAGGCYVALREGVKSRWMTVGHISNTKNWFRRWFYINQNLEGRPVPCDVAQIPQSNPRWSERPDENQMFQVEELLSLMDFRAINGIVIASQFVCHRIQPLKERVNFMFEYQGRGDPSRESREELAQEEVENRLAKMFEGFAKYSFPEKGVIPFTLVNSPPPVSEE